jgi:hypothetical protein
MNIIGRLSSVRGDPNTRDKYFLVTVAELDHLWHLIFLWEYFGRRGSVVSRDIDFNSGHFPAGIVRLGWLTGC